MPTAYRHIAVASTFSPRFLAVLAEADRLAARLEARLSIIHADEEDAERTTRFAEAMRQLERKEVTPVLWTRAETPAEAILTACEKNEVDLLLAGALERESDHRYFLGGVARELLKRTTCDLLLFPKPEELENEIDSVLVEVDLKNLSVPLLNRACEIAARMGAKRITFFAIVTPFDEAKGTVNGTELPTNEEEFAALLDEVDGFDGEADCQILRSNTGFSACDFVENSGAKLLMVGARNAEGTRQLPPHMDWLLQVIPTNVWLLGT